MPERARAAMGPGREDPRPGGLLEYERKYWSQGVSGLAGVDEAGRGPLAGPVVAAAVILEPGVAVDGAADSKLLTRARRESVYADVLVHAAAVAVGSASVRVIDRINVLEATALAMRRALERLPRAPEHVVVDGLPMRSLGRPHDAVVAADAGIHSVACASIVAKVVRDRIMTRLALRHPGYGWERNAGYATTDHLEALHRLGPTPHHRKLMATRQLGLDLG